LFGSPNAVTSILSAALFRVHLFWKAIGSAVPAEPMAR
jgi:hypothetical protein